MEFTADQLKELESRGLTAADVAIQMVFMYCQQVNAIVIYRFTKTTVSPTPSQNLFPLPALLAACLNTSTTIHPKW